MVLFKKDKPDIVFKVHLCSQHKNFCSVIANPVKTKVLPNNIVGKKVVKDVKVLDNGKEETIKMPCAEPDNRIDTGNRVSYLFHEVSGVQKNPIYKLSPELVKNNLRWICQCPLCKVEIEC